MSSGIELILLLRDKQFPLEQFEASRAIRGNSTSVNSALPPLNRFRSSCRGAPDAAIFNQTQLLLSIKNKLNWVNMISGVGPYGRFPKFHRVFWPRPWHIEIRHRVKKTSTMNLFGFETPKLKIRRLKLWKPTVYQVVVSRGAGRHKTSMAASSGRQAGLDAEQAVAVSRLSLSLYIYIYIYAYVYTYMYIYIYMKVYIEMSKGQPIEKIASATVRRGENTSITTITILIITTISITVITTIVIIYSLYLIIIIIIIIIIISLFMYYYYYH